MYELIKGTLEGQDGNRGYSEEIIGVFRFLEEAIDCYYKRPQNGWLRYYARDLKTGRIIDLPIHE